MTTAAKVGQTYSSSVQKIDKAGFEKIVRDSKVKITMIIMMIRTKIMMIKCVQDLIVKR